MRSLRALLFFCLSIASVQARKTTIDQMEAAVHRGDMVVLKKLMKKFDRERRTPQERKEALSTLIEACGYVQKRPPSLLQSGWDLTACIGGALIAVYGIYHLVYSIHKDRSTITESHRCTDCKRIYCDGSCWCGLCSHERSTCSCSSGPSLFYAKTCRFCAVDGCRGSCTGAPRIIPQGEKNWLYASILGSTGATVLGLYQMIKGLGKSNQRSIFSMVHSMEEYLENEISTSG